MFLNYSLCWLLQATTFQVSLWMDKEVKSCREIVWCLLVSQLLPHDTFNKSEIAFFNAESIVSVLCKMWWKLNIPLKI